MIHNKSGISSECFYLNHRSNFQATWTGEMVRVLSSQLLPVLIYLGAPHWLALTSSPLIPLSLSLSPHCRLQGSMWAWLPALHEVIRRTRIHRFKLGLLAEPRGFPSQASCLPRSQGCSSSGSSPRAAGPSSTSLFSSIKQPLVNVPWERTSFPFQWMTEMEAPAFIMFRLVSEGHMPLFSLVTPWQARNDVWGFYKQEILGFSSWHLCYKKLLSGSCKWIQKYQNFWLIYWHIDKTNNRWFFKKWVFTVLLNLP